MSDIISEQYSHHRLIKLLRVTTCIALLSLLGACASNPNQDMAGTESQNVENVDKFEGFNRAMFGFNRRLDRWILKPLAKGYKNVAPEPVELGVGNFFNNVAEVTNVLNDVLQWKWKQAGNDSGRFLINSTVGVLGLFDVASRAGLKRSDGEDFGQTLAVWGVPQGSYLVLPFMGPSTIRDTAAFPVDYYSDPLNYLDDPATENRLTVFELVHERAQLLSTEDLASGDMYLFVRDAYLQRREFLINDGEVEDDFGGEFNPDDF